MLVLATVTAIGTRPVPSVLVFLDSFKEVLTDDV